MSEFIRSELTFSPEGMLEVTVSLHEDLQIDVPEGYQEARIKEKYNLLEKLDSQSGVETRDDNDIASIRVDVHKRLGKYFNVHGDKKIAEFIYNLGEILPIYPIDLVDRVFALQHPSALGSKGDVYHHFQRWINRMEIPEEIGRQFVSAMAIPFDKEHQNKAKRNFGHRSGDNFVQVSGGYLFNLDISLGEFGLIKCESTPEESTETRGKVNWSWLTLSTLGQCACWGVAGDDRERIRIRPQTKRLYEMYPHNVDYARQALSQILGMGALAYHAARYEGHEDIFAKVEWEEPTIYPKT